MTRRKLLDLGDQQAYRFREIMREHLRKRGWYPRDLCELDGLKARSVKWIQNAMVNSRKMPVARAYELFERMLASGASRSPKELGELRRCLHATRIEGRPILAIFRGQTKPLASLLASEAVKIPGIAKRLEAKFRDRFSRTLMPYEEPFTDKRGQLIIESIEQIYGPTWEMSFLGLSKTDIMSILTSIGQTLNELTRYALINRKRIDARRRRSQISK